jgi:D-alanyl-lipoteichoic acid acyltransferase DltB (MBOAT superfamily)
MLFPTLQFGLFFLGVFALVWGAGRHNGWRKTLLLIASWAFYGAWDWRFVALLIASGILNWAAAAMIARSRGERVRRAVFVAGIVANLGVLGLFKYYGFFVQQVGTVLHAVGWSRDLPIFQLILPVGVSFFTFQGVSYVTDVYKRKIDPASLLDVTLLMSFFAHLVAGPIVRASDLVPQFGSTPVLTREMASRGLLLIAWGLFKKTVIASELATSVVDPVFFDPSHYATLDLGVAAYGYAVQIYCDFSAYSDMAIGLAALLGYRFPANFDQPYRASSLQDFWRRWHISLSSWLRDYLYIPLGGSRGRVWRICRNLMATMVLGGIWHGASWTFVLWGALHGSVLAVERVWMSIRPRWLPRTPALIGVIVTFNVVCLGWIFFRAENLDAALSFLSGLGRWDHGRMTAPAYALGLIALGLGLHFLPRLALDRVAVRLGRLPAPAYGLAFGMAILTLDAMRPAGVPPFIYYQF